MKKVLSSSIACLSVCLALGLLTPHAAHAGEEVGTLYYYDLPPQEIRDHYVEWKHFIEYNVYREPCQHYVDPPEGYVLRGCQVYRRGGELVRRTGEEEINWSRRETRAHTVYFDFDKSNIRKGERWKVNQAARDIQNSNPINITVSGYADRAGPADYNVRLSKRRADTVTRDLVNQGVDRSKIRERAYGETHNAVPTPDGVRLQANRRAVIDYNQ